MWVGTGGREPGTKGSGGRRREGMKRESKGGGNRENLRKISQHFVKFCNRNGTKRRKPLQRSVGSGRKWYGKREIQTPLSPHQGCALRKITRSPNVPNYEIQGTQHKAYMKEIRLSSCPKAKVSHLMHPGTLGAQPCPTHYYS